MLPFVGKPLFWAFGDPRFATLVTRVWLLWRFTISGLAESGPLRVVRSAAQITSLAVFN